MRHVDKIAASGVILRDCGWAINNHCAAGTPRLFLSCTHGTRKGPRFSMQQSFGGMFPCGKTVVLCYFSCYRSMVSVTDQWFLSYINVSVTDLSWFLLQINVFVRDQWFLLQISGFCQRSDSVVSVDRSIMVSFTDQWVLLQISGFCCRSMVSVYRSMVSVTDQWFLFTGQWFLLQINDFCLQINGFCCRSMVSVY